MGKANHLARGDSPFTSLRVVGEVAICATAGFSALSMCIILMGYGYESVCDSVGSDNARVTIWV